MPDQYDILLQNYTSAATDRDALRIELSFLQSAHAELLQNATERNTTAAHAHAQDRQIITGLQERLSRAGQREDELLQRAKKAELDLGMSRVGLETQSASHQDFGCDVHHVAGLERKETEREKRNGELVRELDTSDGRVLEHNTECEMLQGRLAELVKNKDVTDERNTLQTSITSFQNQNADLTKERDILESRNAEQAKQIAALTTQQQTLRNRIAELERENKDLTKDHHGYPAGKPSQPIPLFLHLTDISPTVSPKTLAADLSYILDFITKTFVVLRQFSGYAADTSDPLRNEIRTWREGVKKPYQRIEDMVKGWRMQDEAGERVGVRIEAWPGGDAVAGNSTS
jgi:hypothetical protein